MLAMAIEHRLKEIQTVLNQDLMTQLHQLNGWTMEHLPSFEYGDLDEIDLDVFSKAIQRIASVNALELDRPAANMIRKVLGVQLKPEDEDVVDDELTNNRSRSGDGGATPFGGTGTNPNKADIGDGE